MIRWTDHPVFSLLLTLLFDVVEGVDADLGRGGGHPGGEVAGEVDEDEVEGDGRGEEQRPGGPAA